MRSDSAVRVCVRSVTQEAVSPFRSPSEDVAGTKWTTLLERRKRARWTQGALRLTLPEEGELEVEGLPEDLKNSLRRPAASLLRLATLSDFRPSNERQTVIYVLTF